MEKIHSAKAPEAIGVYSQAIKKGEWVYLSGQIGLDPMTMQLVSEDVAAQTKQIFKNIAEILNEAGASIAEIVKITVFLTDLSADYKTLNEVMKEILVLPYPARSVVGVAALPKDAKVEIEVVVCK